MNGISRRAFLAASTAFAGAVAIAPNVLKRRFDIGEPDRFWAAEVYHQDYLRKNPGGYSCHFLRPEWELPPNVDSMISS